MPTAVQRIRSVILGAIAIAALVCSAGAAEPRPSPPHTPEEYDEKIRELEDAIDQLRKEMHQTQAATDEEAPHLPIAGWDNGFFIQSPNGEHKLTVGGYVHLDGYFTTRGTPSTSQISFRRARIDLRGQVFRYFEFRFLPDFAHGDVVIQDAYLNIAYLPWAQPRAGKYKTPFGIERLQSANSITFVRRALPNNLVPNRDLGFMLWGVPFDGALEYQLAILDGVPDGGLNTDDTDFGGGKTFAGRIFVLPFGNMPLPPLHGFGVGLAGTYGQMQGTLSDPQLPVYRIDGQQTFFSYVAAKPPTSTNTAIADGPQARISPQGYWYWGPAGLLWEWVQTNNAVRLAGVTHTVTATAWQTQLSWVVTGEANGYRGPTPARNFDPWRFLDGYWGALEIAARYAALSVEKDVYALGLADPNQSARAARAWSIGANWFLNPMVRLMLDFEENRFTGGGQNGGDRPVEDVIIGRVQFVF